MKLCNIINMFLDFRRLDDKKVALEVLNTDLRGLIDNIAKDTAIQMNRHHNAFEVEVAEDLPQYIACDGFRISQIVSNLLDNARKFVCQNGTVQLRVLLQTATTEKKLQFRIHNDGTKISDEVATRIFQPFIQADARITREYGGTGLGLSICKELSSLMNGSVYVDQSTQTGCTFVFKLPLSPKAEAENKMPIIIAQQTLPSNLTFRVKHILLAEDEPINQRKSLWD